MPQIVYPAKALEGSFEPGITLHEAVRKMGYIIDYACGGNALCATCCVRVSQGEGCLTPVEREEAHMLRDIDKGPGHRLACQARLMGVAGDRVVIHPAGD